MKKYKLVNGLTFSGYGLSDIEKVINELSGDGWEVVSCTGNMIILEMDDETMDITDDFWNKLKHYVEDFQREHSRLPDITDYREDFLKTEKI